MAVHRAKSRQHRLPFCVLSVLLLSMPVSQSLAAQAQQAPDRFESIRQLIRQKLVNHSTSSVAVAVAQHGKIIWEQGFGWANREERIPATANTPYSLASVSKPFTATGLMVLVQAGKINLDRPINDYLGKAKLKAWIGDAKDATVRRVANHSSGLPEHAQFFLPGQKPSDDETIREYGNIVTVPGDHFQYSNIGFGVLGYVVSRVSGKSYGDFMHDAVFGPLGLTHTAVDVPPGMEKLQAVRYDEHGSPIPFYVSDHPGASSVYSSAHDLVRFGMFNLKDHLADQKPILSDLSLDEMHRSTMNVGDAITRNGNGYGVGWGVGDNRADGYRVLAHGGGMPGVSTEIMLVPSEDVAVAVLLNARDHDSAYPIANAILKVLLPKWQMTMPKTQTPVPFHPGAALVGTWKGAVHRYNGNRPATITISSGGDVHVKLGDGLESVLDHAQFRDGALSGEAWGDVGIPDAEQRQAYSLLFDLKLRGNVLSGPVSARSVAGEGANRGSLTQWFEVTKQS